MQHKRRHRTKNKKPVNMIRGWRQVYKQETGGEKLRESGQIGEDLGTRPVVGGTHHHRGISLGQDNDDTSSCGHDRTEKGIWEADADRLSSAGTQTQVTAMRKGRRRAAVVKETQKRYFSERHRGQREKAKERCPLCSINCNSYVILTHILLRSSLEEPEHTQYGTHILTFFKPRQSLALIGKGQSEITGDITATWGWDTEEFCMIEATPLFFHRWVITDPDLFR